MERAITATTALLWLLSSTALAQLASDEVPRERTVPEREQIRRDMEESRFRLGPFRILPRLLVNNTGYDSNVFGSADHEVSDWTADVGIGVHAILPAGSKVYFVADAVPSYIWYSRFSQERTLGGLYRGSLLGFFNRMTVETAAYDSKMPTILNSETEARVLQDLRDGSARLEIDLTRRLALFASGEYQRVRYSLGSEVSPGLSDEVGKLDRTDQAARGGLRYRFSPNFNVSVAAESARTSFVVDGPARDNKSHAYLLGIHYDRPRFFVNLTGGYRKGGLCNCIGAFPSYQTATGSYFMSFIPVHRLELQVYGHRGPIYSLFQQNPYYLETRNGGGPVVHLGRRLALHAFGEFGTNSYPVGVEAQGAVIITRHDTAKTWGGGASFAIMRSGALTLMASRTRYTSNFPGFNRSVFRLTAGFTFEGGLP